MEDSDVLTDTGAQMANMRELDQRDETRVTRHKGAIVGLWISLLGIAGTATFASWFTDGRKMELNGPMASIIMLGVTAGILGFAKYEAWMLKNNPWKRSFYTGMSWATLPIGGATALTLIVTYGWRGQTGLSFNGIEAMTGLATLIVPMLLAEVVAFHNLGGLKRKQKAPADG